MTATTLAQATERLLRYAALLSPPWRIRTAADLEMLADGLRNRQTQPPGARTPHRIRAAAQRYYGVAPATQREAFIQARRTIPDDGSIPRHKPK